MTAVLLDTHAIAWTLNEPDRLGRAARAAMEAAASVYVSPISFYEIGQKTRLGKWPEMELLAPRLLEVLAERGARIAPLGADICLAAAVMDWDHRDPFDRILAATGVAVGAPLVSADTVFDPLPAVARIW